MKIRLSLLIAAVTFPVFAVILKCSSVTVSPMRSVHAPKLLETWYGRLSKGILHDRARREKERMSFYLLPASWLLQDACQLRQSTVEGSKRQKIKTCRPDQQCQDCDIKPKYGVLSPLERWFTDNIGFLYQSLLCSEVILFKFVHFYCNYMFTVCNMDVVMLD